MIRFFKFACLWVAACSLAFLAPAQNLQHRRKAFRTVASSNLPAASTVLAWYALESNGNDSTSNARNLTASGSPPHGTGKVSNCFANTASSNWYTGTVAAWMSPASSFSICAWIKAADMTPTNAAGILTQYTTTAGNRSFLFRLETSGKIALIVSSDGSAVVSAVGDTVMSDNTWYFVCGVFEASTAITVYVNGASDKVNSTSIPSAVYQSSTQNIQVGSYSSSSTNTFVGSIDEVGFFDTALTEPQVLALYNGGGTALGVTFSALP